MRGLGVERLRRLAGGVRGVGATLGQRVLLETDELLGKPAAEQREASEDDQDHADDRLGPTVGLQRHARTEPTDGEELIAGAGIYYTNHYAYLERFEPAEITLINRTSGESETIAFADMSAIRATSTPLRFRACFTVSESVDTLAATYLEADKPEPLVAPNSFRPRSASAPERDWLLAGKQMGPGTPWGVRKHWLLARMSFC